MYVKDPTVYPIVFKMDRRELSLIDNKFATTTFMCPSGEILQNCFYTYDGSYITDMDTTSSEDMSFIKDGKASVFEFMADSVSVFSSNFNMRVWVDDASSTFIKSGENINLRQFP